ncbi:hypothetical protein [Streptomyces uncialis]|uniref:Chaplin domain-containing protein n=1 Tax=Streptomyces uncialis TaxID=1048205 RepID=A0A1Q4VCD4_9ACTN|nr:hypothetical protein [Streptomyces uncialis]OKH95350.1 hypothetical protein AB852_00205 [Streptomyces uncialis]WTE14222.1 hypothetical protein OG924_30750 [Streptomyces uncialis]
MGVETRGTRGGAGRVGVRTAVLGAVAGVALVPAGAAHASIIGIGNAVFGNACVTQGDSRAVGVTAAGSGLGGGNQTGLPLDLRRNQCGNSGVVCFVDLRPSV